MHHHEPRRGTLLPIVTNPMIPTLVFIILVLVVSLGVVLVSKNKKK